LPSSIQMFKHSRLRWAGREAWTGKERNVYGIFVGKPNGKSLPTIDHRGRTQYPGGNGLRYTVPYIIHAIKLNEIFVIKRWNLH